MLRLSLPLLAIALAGVAACNPYDPTLGKTPFLCGSDDPKCPSGYDCLNGICQESVSIDAPGSSFQCANDSTVEGASRNDDFMHAFVTPIPSMTSYSLIGLALCPEGDKDHYQFNVNQTGTNLDVSVSSAAGRTTPSVNLLGNNGALIASGLATSAQLVNLRVDNRLAVGSGPYYIQVSSPDNSENNYDLSIKICTTPTPCP